MGKNDLTIVENDMTVIEYENIVIECPKCGKKKKLKIPVKIIDQSKQLTTVSIPGNLVCEHSFQAYVDKNYMIRGYHNVDFDFSHLEFYEGGRSTNESDQEAVPDFTSKPLFQKIIALLRESVDEKEILGSGVFTIEGHVLYSSLPHGALSNTMREFEVRSEKKLVNLKKMFLELENNQKIFSNYMEIEGTEFVLVLFFSKKVKLGMGNLILRELVKKINGIN
ncbi:MAG: hypothetical protein GF353_01750 [Candidatus Lokiarchaeota archaeon]|nr:hypothetical protein [Candidatus Lokiarchaeota archaeon]